MRFGKQVEYRDKVTSTMDRARELLLAGPVADGTVIVAGEQTKGKGRAGRSWMSPEGSLSFTLITQLDGFQRACQMNLAVSVAIARVCRSYGISNTGAKWPNDVWVDDKKLGGILLDIEDGWKVALGVGLNVNNDIKEAAEGTIANSSTSMALELEGRTLAMEEVLAAILLELEKLMNSSMDVVLRQYSRFDVLQNQRVVVMPKRIEDPESYYEAVSLGVSSDGFLRVRLDSGEERTLSAEEVSIRTYLNFRNN